MPLPGRRHTASGNAASQLSSDLFFLGIFFTTLIGKVETVITDFKNKTAVLTGAGSGFGLEMARIGARLGMNLVLVDVQQDALDAAATEARDAGAQVLAQRVDVSQAAHMEELGRLTFAQFGAPHLVFNNAGVASGGLIWENTAADWAWVMGVNLMGVAHGVRVFTPMMLAAAKADPAWRGHIVNTASVAGLVNTPNMGVYNASKHAVVSLSETLYQDLALVTDQISASVLCPYFVPTGISQSHRNRPANQPGISMSARPTQSQMISQAMSDKAVGSGKVTAAEVAQKVFDAVAGRQFYIHSHPHMLASVQTRMEDILQLRNPSDPFAQKPEIGQNLRQALRASV
jgi:NAD(P)-dependent dehydrogenase (short-subunit alcohol dehydrogenase family)